MRRVVILRALMGAITLLLAAAALPHVGQAAAPRTPSGAYAFSFTGHDPTVSPNGQDIVGAGAIVFDGAGGLTGRFGEENVTPGATPPRDVVTGSFTGRYFLTSDGVAEIDYCGLYVDNGTPFGSPLKSNLVGAFSDAFKDFRFVLTNVRFVTDCNDAATANQPNAVVTFSGAHQ